MKNIKISKGSGFSFWATKPIRKSGSLNSIANKWVKHHFCDTKFIVCLLKFPESGMWIEICLAEKNEGYTAW